MNEKLYNTGEIVNLLGIARETVYRKVKSGEIPAIRVGGGLRFPSSLIEKWLQTKGGEHPDRWRSHLNRFADLLRETFGPALKSVVLFGSFASRRETAKSDIDLLIVCDAFLRSRLERQSTLFDLGKKITPAFAHKISPVPLTSHEALEPRPLYLGILSAHEILWDPDGFFQKRLDAVRNDLERGGAEQRVDEEGVPYWVFPYTPGTV